MSTDFTTARRTLYAEVEDFGFNFTASGYNGSGYIQTEDPRVNQGGSYTQTERYRGAYIIRPDRSAGDQVRPAGDTSYGSLKTTIAHDGPAWSNTADTNAEISVLTLAELQDTFNKALAKLRNNYLVPLYHGPADADMQASAHGDWDDTNASFDKQTSALEVLSGKRSGTLTLSGSGGYTQAAALSAMGRGKSGSMFFRAKADVGTGIARMVDNADATIESISFSQEEWLFGKKLFTLSSSQELIRPRLLGTDTSDQIDVQDFWFVKHDSLIFRLPSWLNETATIKAVYRAYFDVPGDEQDTYIADAMELETLVEGTHYRHYYRPGTANPHTIVIERQFKHLLTEPLFIDVEQPWSHPFGVSAVFSTEASATECPADLLIAQAKLQLAEFDGSRFGDLISTALPEKRYWSYKLRSPEPREARGWNNAFRRW